MSQANQATAQWHFVANGQQNGPIPWAELKRLVASGKLARFDRVWTEGLAEWTSAGQIKGLFDGAPPMQPPMSPQSASITAPNYTEFGEHMYCSFCGQQILKEAVICPHCGCATAKFEKTISSSDEVSKNVIIASYIAGAFIPFIGWGMAIYLLVKGKAMHAIGVGVLSTVMVGFWAAALNN